MSPKETKRLSESRSSRFESISLVYLAFFVIAVMSPQIISRDYFGLQQAYWEEILIFFSGLASLVTFSVYERLMEKRIQERDAATQSAERAKKELVDSYRYIGSVNRQIDLLKRLTNETSMKLVKSDAYWKDLLQSLASNAAVCAGSDRALIRFVELDRIRTDREVMYALNKKTQIKVANKDLKVLAEENAPHAYLLAEDGQTILVIPSDKRDTDIRAHLLIPVRRDELTDMEVSLLKVFANQAELVYHQLIREKQPATALEVVNAVASGEVGEVS